MSIFNMYAKLLYFVSAVIYKMDSITALRAPFIHKCMETDNDCLAKTATESFPILVDGLPEFGIEPMDPMFFENIIANSANLRLTFKNATLTGLRNCTVESISYGGEKSKTFLVVECTDKLHGSYDGEGKILLFQVKGQGQASITLNKISVELECSTDKRTGDDGKTYLTILNPKYTYKLKDIAEIRLEDFLSKNELLRRAASMLFATYPNEIVMDVGGPLINTVVDRIIGNAFKMFDYIPMEDILIMKRK